MKLYCRLTELCVISPLSIPVLLFLPPSLHAPFFVFYTWLFFTIYCWSSATPPLIPQWCCFQTHWPGYLFSMYRVEAREVHHWTHKTKRGCRDTLKATPLYRSQHCLHHVAITHSCMQTSIFCVFFCLNYVCTYCLLCTQTHICKNAYTHTCTYTYTHTHTHTHTHSVHAYIYTHTHVLLPYSSGAHCD